MANTDVRSMLRNERLSRRIDHPHAVYTASGQLQCSVCQLQIRSDALWEPHLAGRPHKIMLQRQQDEAQERRSAAPPALDSHNIAPTNGKKRKAESDDDSEETRKKPKAAEGYPDRSLRSTTTLSDMDIVEDTISLPNPLPTPDTISSVTANAAIDEDEWAAFEREIATPPPDPTPFVFTAAATISAAPISAAELAARSREEASTQAKEQREAEVEAEKEDAARHLEEEFDEMEELESRVRKLREKREALRKRRKEEAASGRMVVDEDEKIAGENGSPSDGDDEDEDEDIYDDFEGWGIR